MTVKELIEELQKHDPEALVCGPETKRSENIIADDIGLTMLLIVGALVLAQLVVVAHLAYVQGRRWLGKGLRIRLRRR